MDKFEYKIRADEIKELISQERYAEAAEIADTIDWRRVKSVMMLCTISDLYKMNRRYEDARDILLLAYDRRPGGRTICYSLCELSIKMDEIPQAKEYLDEFVRIAPKDSSRYILQYKLLQALDVSMEERIEVLQKLKEQDPRERWQYELAYLYHMVGLESHCVDECDELVLWFGQGKYVIKALELKMLHQPLTEQQQALYNEYKWNLERSKKKALEEEKQPAEFEEMPIQVKTMDVGQYNTINLQEELAADLEKVLQADYQNDKGNPVENPVTRAIVEPLYEYDTESFDVPEIEEVSVEDVEAEDISAQATPEEEPETEVFFGETKEFCFVPQKEEASREVDFESEEQADAVSDEGAEAESEAVQAVEADADAVLSEQNIEEAVPEEEEVLLQEEVPSEPAESRPVTVVAEPPKFMAEVMSQDYDGQLSLVMPESESVEKQITGQLNIEDILAEWERRKKENEEKRKEEVRQHVLEQTGSMFTDFEASMRDGLLEQLESGRISMNQVDDLIQEMEEPSEEIVPVVEEDADNEDITEVLAEEAEIAEGFPETEAAETDLQEEFPEVEEAADEEEIAELADVIEEVPEDTEEAEAESEEDFEEADQVEELEEIVDEQYYESAEENAAEEADAVEMEQDVPESFEEISEDTEAIETEDAVAEPEAEEEFEAAVEEAEEEFTADAEEPEEESTAEAEEAAEEAEEILPAEPEEVERDAAKVRSLSREEKDLFAPYIQSRKAREQLIAVLDNVSMASYTGNLMITGEEGVDIFKLADSIVYEIKQTDSNFNGKSAEVLGVDLDEKSIEETLEDLEGGALIVSGASDMKVHVAKRLNRLLQQEDFGIVAILLDTREGMDHLLKTCPFLKESFTARMDVEDLSNSLLVDFGKKYAEEQEYVIDSLGELALHTCIESLQTSSHTVTTEEVKEIVDDAIYHVNRKTLGHFFDIVLARRYNEDDMIILSENDFDCDRFRK